MDKKFWKTIQENDYAVPVDQTLEELTEGLFSCLGSIDSELRDAVGLEVFYHWVKRDIYSAEEIRGFVSPLVKNLQEGLGELENDYVFLRSFSSLWLAIIVGKDTKDSVLLPEDVSQILNAALAYLPLEKDLRGLVHKKGWAHAVAHAADLIGELARNPYTNSKEHITLLDCVATRLKITSDSVYLYSEDCRLSRAVKEVLARNTLTLDQIQNWLGRLSVHWQGSWKNEKSAKAFFNGRNFIRCLHWQLISVENISDKEIIQKMLRDTLDNCKPWEFSE